MQVNPLVVHRLLTLLLVYVNDSGTSITKYSEFSRSRPLYVLMVSLICYFSLSREGRLSTDMLTD